MKKKLLFLVPVLLLTALAIWQMPFFKNSSAPKQVDFPAPVEGEENEKLRELYNELRHKAAPGVVWEDIERQNAVDAAQQRMAMGQRASFANGNINGVWEEKGANNQAGSIRAVDYVPATNTLYTIGNGGSLWTSVLGTGVWTLRNQLYQFETRAVKAFTKISGGERVLLGRNLNIFYSDDNGVTLNPSAGITFPVAWGGNYIAGIYRLNDGSNTIYCLTRCWSNAPWAARFRLYMSTNEGQSFTQIYQFDTGDDNRISVCNPYNSNDLLVADIGSSPASLKLFSVTGATVFLLNTGALGSAFTNCTFKGTFSGGIYYLYAMLNNSQIYQSTNLGVSWTLQSVLPESGWNKMNVSINDPLRVSYGGVNAYRSANGGTSFTRVNTWSDYYSNVSGKLHADIMEIEYFKKTDNTEFCIVDCHGGTYVSYDNLVTVSNLSLSSHRAVEYYDVLTDTLNPNRIFAGSQDQGLQRTLTGTNGGIQNFIQVISGDYGQMALTNNNTILWPQYPGGDYYFYTNLGNPSPTYIGNWTVLGSQKPNYGWMLPATSTTNPAANEIFIGGGNMTGGGGSYLIKATMLTASPYTVSTTQYSYDFRANSNSGTAGITAIEQSPLNANKLFVATEDGTFFYSNDYGANWTKNATFTGPTPWYLYGSCILASRINQNTIWYSGSGYSNPGVYRSTDGGATFTAISNGLPATLVTELVASPDEQFLFAATEAGPYVYVASENLWYTLADNTVPVQHFTSVEYIRSSNTVRFGTMGRGIWDFKITSTVPVVLSSWTAEKKGNQVLCSWVTEQELNASHFIVERSTDWNNFTSIGTIAASGGTMGKQYSLPDRFPAKGYNYYRLMMVDNDGRKQQSTTVVINFDGTVSPIALYPNPVKNILYATVDLASEEKLTVSVLDMSGKKVLQLTQVVVPRTAIAVNVSKLPKAVYTILVEGKNIRHVHQFLKD
ncbi:MAG: T9SS type A sorting domain-containing protein [Ferruginibacter sp.]